MLSKPLGFSLLALGCLTAAAGGAYVATRHNAADTFATAPAAVTAPAPAVPTAQPAQPVTETEAVVATPKTTTTPEAEPESKPAETRDEPAPAPKRSTHSKPAPQPRRTAPAAVDRPATTKDAMTPSPEPAPVANAAPTTPVEQPRSIDPQPAPRTPQFEEVVVPASSVIGLQLETAISSDRARVEDRVEARVTRDVLADGHVAIPAGARMLGSVTMVDRGGKVKEPARLGIRFHTLILGDGSEVALRTEAITREGESPAGDSAKKIGGAAIGGAILGGILGGGKGAVVGGMAGAGGGTAAVMAGDRRAVTIPSGSIVTARLSAPVTVQVEKRN